MYFNLLIVFIPLIIGYLIPKINKFWIKIVNKILNMMVYIILFFMGINLSLLPNFINNIITIINYTIISALCILFTNILALSFLEKKIPWKNIKIKVNEPSYYKMFIISLKSCLMVILGFTIGFLQLSIFNITNKLSEVLLVILLWLIGVQLRNSNVSIRQIILNQRGLLIALVVAVSALLGGVLISILLNLPISVGLSLASTYGWYSLSGILMTDVFGTVIGSVAFFNDLLRELFAIMFVPILMKKRHNTAIGICGATSMDFALPVLQSSGGNEIIPTAIVNGFLLSLLAPILLTTFSS